MTRSFRRAIQGTEVMSPTVTDAPRIIEFGIEKTELVKRDGRWLYKSRIVTSEGGMPASELKTWKKRDL